MKCAFWYQLIYTAKIAQVVTSQLTSCNRLVMNKPKSGGVRMAGDSLLTTSLLQVVNRRVASWLSKFVITVTMLLSTGVQQNCPCQLALKIETKVRRYFVRLSNSSTNGLETPKFLLSYWVMKYHIV